MVDRLPVLLTSLTDGNTKLLGVPQMKCGSGQAAADAVYEQLRLWDCTSLAVGMCFDTTAANTGRLSGACRLLEDVLGRSLLWLACRHHVLEVLLSDAFAVCFGPSSGPDIIIFKRFRDIWSRLNHKPAARAVPLFTATDELKAFIHEQLNHHHPRDDYLELLSLSSLLVGMTSEATIHKPGAMHRARWMSKAIYSLKRTA
jgi:hypothetical protein